MNPQPAIASITAQTNRNLTSLTILLRWRPPSMQAAARRPSRPDPARPGSHMRYRRDHSKPVLPWSIFARHVWSTTRPAYERDETIVADRFTLYSKDREKPPFANRVLRPVGQCDARPQDRQHGCRRAGSQRRAIRIVGTRSRSRLP